MHRRSATASGHEITKNLSVTAKCTSAVNLTHRNRALWGSRRGAWKEEEREWEMEWKWNMEREEGETVVSFQRERGKREKEREHKEWNPLSHLTGRNENLCRYQGGCFYSGVSIATVSMCPFYRPAVIIMQRVKKKKNTQMPETIWLLVIRQRQTSLFNSPYCIYTVQADTHTLLQKQANTRVFHKFGMTRYAPSMGFLKKQEGQKGFNKKCDVQKQLHYDFYLCSSLINFFPYLSLCLSIPGSLCVLICTFPVYLFVYVCVVIYPVWSWHVVIFRKTDWDREALPRP